MAVTVQRQVGTATAQRNFSRKQRNSYGTYVILTEFTQRRNGNGMVETRHRADLPCVSSTVAETVGLT